MGRTETLTRPVTASARKNANPYASSYDQVASPLTLNFPAGTFTQGSASESNSPPDYDQFGIPTGLDGSGGAEHDQGHGVDPSAMMNNGPPQLVHNSHPIGNPFNGAGATRSGQVTPQTPADELPEGTYALEPDEFGSYPGFPSVGEYDDIQEAYLKNLSSRKQEKALITQAMYDSIHAVLMDPTNTTYGTPQFRFWVRKMFVLAAFQGEYTVTHEDKPVAAKEQIYQILVHCHGECYHGGRDKTCTQIKQYYSWIPKELVAQFVKACPTCVLKRSNNPKKFVAMLKDIGGASGPEEEYIDYFTSPNRGKRAGRPNGVGPPGLPARYSKPDMDSTNGGHNNSLAAALKGAPPPMNFGIPNNAYNAYNAHQQRQQMYSSGLLDEVAGSLHLSSAPTSASGSSQAFSRRASGENININVNIAGGSQAHTPLSGVFPHNIYGEMDQHAQGWAAQQQQQFIGSGGVAMGRQAGRSLDDGTGRFAYPPPFQPHQQQVGGAAAMGFSLSEGAIQVGQPTGHPGRIDMNGSEADVGHFYGLPTFSVSSDGQHQHQQLQGSVDIAGDGSLIVNGSTDFEGRDQQHAGQGEDSEDSNDLTDAQLNLHLGPSSLVNRRRGPNAPVAPLNLNLAGSNFSEYRGGQLLSAGVTPTTGVSSGSVYTPNGESGGAFSPGVQAGDSGTWLHHPRPGHPIRSASLLEGANGGALGSAVATTFPSLSIGSGDGEETGAAPGGGAEQDVEMNGESHPSGLSALDVLASSAVGYDQQHQIQFPTLSAPFQHHPDVENTDVGHISLERHLSLGEPRPQQLAMAEDLERQQAAYDDDGPEEEEHGEHSRFVGGGEVEAADGIDEGEAQ